MSAIVLGMGQVGAGWSAPPGGPRMPRLDRMALAAAEAALAGAALRPAALVFGTGYGGLTSTVEFLEGMAARGPAFGSPTAFHESVHHAPAGQLSIRLGLTGPSLTVSSREVSGESALKVGLDLLKRGHAPVLVVAADEVVPALASAFGAFTEGAAVAPAEGAAAVLLGIGQGCLQVAEACLGASPTRTLRFADEAVRLVRLLRVAGALAGPKPWVSRGWVEARARAAESAALAEAVPDAELLDEGERVGFNPSGGLLRVVALAERLRDAKAARGGIVHGMSLGGGQAAVVLRHEP